MKNLIRQWANLYMESVNPEFHEPDGFERQDDFDKQSDDWEEVEEEKRKLAKEVSLSKSIKEDCEDDEQKEKVDEVMDPLDIIKKAEEKKSSTDNNSIKSVKVIEFRPEDGYVFAEVIKGNGQKQEVEMEITDQDSMKEFKRLESLYRKEFKTEIPQSSIDKIVGSIEDETDTFDTNNKEGKKSYLGTISLIRQEVDKDSSGKDNIDWLVPTPDFDKVSYAKGKEGEQERKADEKARKREMRRNASDDFAELNSLDADDNDDERIGKERSPETDSSEDHRNDNDEDVFKDQENPDDYEVE